MAPATPSVPPLDPMHVRADFPGLRQLVNGKPLVYLDSAATAQKPAVVVTAVTQFYTADCANIHRGVHALSQRATLGFERARAAAQDFLGAANTHEIIFVRGTTEAINLVAQAYARPTLREGDEIVVTEMEHHSNLVPWQMVAQQTGARVVKAPIRDDGALDMDAFVATLGPRTKIVAVAHVSNALGTVNPIREICRLAHDAGAVVVVDGAQAVPHTAIDVVDLGADFYAFSAHKLYGPTGSGVLYGREALLDAMPPWMGGGEMIRTVSFSGTTYNELPHKFEAGTPDIAGGIGLGAAIRYVQGLGLDRIAAHEHALLEYATQRLLAVPGLRLIGTAPEKSAVLSFVLDGVHPHDIGTILDSRGIAVRTGHHCAQPVMQRFGVPATTRASLAIYNTRDDIDALAEGLEAVKEMMT